MNLSLIHYQAGESTTYTYHNHYLAGKSITGFYHYHAVIATGKQSTIHIIAGDPEIIIFSRDWFDVREEQQPSTGRGTYSFSSSAKTRIEHGKVYEAKSQKN